MTRGGIFRRTSLSHFPWKSFGRFDFLAGRVAAGRNRPHAARKKLVELNGIEPSTS